jgi:hypothetical protein
MGHPAVFERQRLAEERRGYQWGKLLKQTIRKFKQRIAVYWKRQKYQSRLDKLSDSVERA